MNWPTVCYRAAIPIKHDVQLHLKCEVSGVMSVGVCSRMFWILFEKSRSCKRSNEPTVSEPALKNESTHRGWILGLFVGFVG